LSKKESAVKLSKREQLRAERRRQSLVWNGLILGGGGLVILLVVWYFVASAGPGPLPGEQLIADEGTGHQPEGTPLTFLHYPPSSGTHYPSVARWGVYTEPISEGIFVHNLEHGGVVFLYYCDTPCPDLEQQFSELYEKAPPDNRFGSRKILVTPYDKAKMPSPIVALAWNHQLDMQTFDEETLLKWYRRFVNGGPEGLEQP
jgi:hypothetical protein